MVMAAAQTTKTAGEEQLGAEDIQGYTMQQHMVGSIQMFLSFVNIRKVSENSDPSATDGLRLGCNISKQGIENTACTNINFI